jgi:extradiol dioxygenase family protein
MQPFHLAFPVANIEESRRFYGDLLGARVGRSAERWIDFDFWGHQISAHLVDAIPSEPTNRVDGKEVPTRHFGIVLEWTNWHELAEKLQRSGIDFLLEPHIRFVGQPGEQATLFIVDPSGNALEFKAFRDPSALFSTA